MEEEEKELVTRGEPSIGGMLPKFDILGKWDI